VTVTDIIQMNGHQHRSYSPVSMSYFCRVLATKEQIHNFNTMFTVYCPTLSLLHTAKIITCYV